MGSTYSRVTEVNEKIRSVQLTITQWRVLFAINEGTSFSDIAEYVEADEKTIQESLSVLDSMGLVNSESSVADGVEVETESVEDSDATVVEELEESIEVEDEPITDFEEQPEDEPEAEEEIVFEEEADELSVEENLEIEEDVIEEEIVEEEVIEEVIEEEIVEEEIVEEEIVEEVEMGEDDSAELVEESVIDDDSVASENSSDEDTVEESKEPDTTVESASGKKIMVVDDSIVIRKMVELAFEGQGMDIVGYANAKDATDAFGNENPDIVIMEPALPDAKGEDLLKTLKDIKSIPVIMFSGKNASMEIDNVDDFVQKPFKDDDLVQKVLTLIN